MEPYRSFLTAISTGAAYDELVDTEVKQGFIRRLDLITCENVDHAFTELRIGIRRYGVDYWLEGEKSPSVATLYWMDDPVILAEDEQLMVRFTGCTPGDELKVTIVGLTRQIAPVLEIVPETAPVPAHSSPEAAPPLPSIAAEIEKIPSLPPMEGKAPRKRYVWELRKTIEEASPGA